MTNKKPETELEFGHLPTLRQSLEFGKRVGLRIALVRAGLNSEIDLRLSQISRGRGARVVERGLWGEKEGIELPSFDYFIGRYTHGIISMSAAFK